MSNLKSILRKELDWLNSKFPVILRLLQSKPSLLGHSLHVVNIAIVIAREIGMNEEETVQLSRGCIVHDIGKAYWPEAYDTKPILLDEERIFIKSHCEAGYNFLKANGYPLEYSLISLQHHERCNGYGYPYRLSNNALSAGIKIAAIADAYEAMTNKRSYRNFVFTSNDALNVLAEDPGYERNLVQVLQNIESSKIKELV